MRLLSTLSPLARLLLLASAATLSHAEMAAWFTDLGPQVILQNETTQAIHYTTCNLKDQITYSPTELSVFKLTGSNAPKNNTALAGSGYWDEKKTVASIYYLNENDVIINALFNCNMVTGLFELAGAWPISGVAPLPLSHDSGLAAILLGPKAGFRIYYHDENMAVNELAYKPADGWKHGALISQDAPGSRAIAAAWTGNENITVVTARDKENIGAIRYHDDSVWHIASFPHPLAGDFTMDTSPENITIDTTATANFTLPGWTGKPGALGMSIDSKYTRSVWYIGEDRNLYQIASKNRTWSHQNSQPADIWPVADSANASLAVASDYTSGKLRIYYLVDGALAELKNEGGEWQKWTYLPSPEPVKAETPPPGPELPLSEDDNNGGLSSGAKIGLGVGISLGVLAIAAITAAVLLLRRKQSVDKDISGAETGDGSYKPIGSSGSPSTQYSSHSGVSPPSSYDHYAWDKEHGAITPLAIPPGGVYQLDATGRPVELDSPRQMYELSDQPHAHELMGSEAHLPQQVQPQQQQQQQQQQPPPPPQVRLQPQPPASPATG